MALSTAVLVCSGAALIVVAAHCRVWLARRSARAQGRRPDPATDRVAVGLCLLALLVPVAGVLGAAHVTSVFLLLGTAAAIMAATVPLLPSPKRRPARASGAGAARPARAVRSARSGRSARTASAAGAGPGTARRRGEPALPPTPLSRPLGATLRKDPRPGEGTTPPSAPRLPANDEPTGPLRRIPNPVGNPAIPPAQNPDDHQVEQASETLVELDRVVEDVSGLLRLGPRPQASPGTPAGPADPNG